MTKKTQSQPVSEKFILQQFDKLNDKIKTLDRRLINNTSGLTSSVLKMEIKLTQLEFKIENLESDYKKFAIKMEKRFDQVMKHLDGLAGTYKKVDQEQTLLSHKSSEHEERLEKLEQTVFAAS